MQIGFFSEEIVHDVKLMSGEEKKQFLRQSFVIGQPSNDAELFVIDWQERKDFTR